MIETGGTYSNLKEKKNEKNKRMKGKNEIIETLKKKNGEKMQLYHDTFELNYFHLNQNLFSRKQEEICAKEQWKTKQSKITQVKYNEGRKQSMQILYH